MKSSACSRLRILGGVNVSASSAEEERVLVRCFFLQTFNSLSVSYTHLDVYKRQGNTFGLSDLAQNGQNMTGEVAGTIEGVLPEEAHDAQAQDQTQIPVEDTQLPDWLASQLDEGAAEASTAVKTTGKDGTYRTLLSVLVIVFTTCGIVTIGFAVALAEAAKKRKATQVHY